MTITEFLRARIAEDRITAAASQRDPWRVGHKSSCDWWGDMPGYCTCDATARALAECAAKHEIVRDAEDHIQMLKSMPDDVGMNWAVGALKRTLWSLSFPYNQHRDFDARWQSE